MTLRAFAAYAVEALTNADSKLYATLRTLVLRPGVLTREFMAGRRKPYVGPLQIFLVCNVLFFLLLQLRLVGETFTTDLVFHRTQAPYGGVAEAMLTERLGELPDLRTGNVRGTWIAQASPEQAAYRQRFNEATPRYANSMVIIMVPMFAAGVMLLRRRGLAARDLVFSLHFYAFLLLFLSVMSLLFRAAVSAWRPLTPVLNSESVFALTVLSAGGAYLTKAFRIAYGGGWPLSAARAVVALALMVFVLMVYRAILFFVVFWATG
jgi:hypothetical protein